MFHRRKGKPSTPEGLSLRSTCRQQGNCDVGVEAPWIFVHDLLLSHNFDRSFHLRAIISLQENIEDYNKTRSAYLGHLHNAVDKRWVIEVGCKFAVMCL